jgi:hypothetical protein
MKQIRDFFKAWGRMLFVYKRVWQQALQSKLNVHEKTQRQRKQRKALRQQQSTRDCGQTYHCSTLQEWNVKSYKAVIYMSEVRWFLSRCWRRENIDLLIPGRTQQQCVAGLDPLFLAASRGWLGFCVWGLAVPGGRPPFAATLLRGRMLGMIVEGLEVPAPPYHTG